MAENKIETELLSQIKEVLLTFPKYWEKEVLLRNKVAEDLREYNPELIEALLSNQLVKDTYSITLDSTNIFKIEEFISMLRYKNYWENSYTKYSNKIGLTSEGKYLNYNTDVVLDFPHKDSVLEGGMTKEDQGKKEIYYHNVLAKEEIDTLLSPKVLTNIKKYDKNGEHDIDDFTDQDNLIIKGNNLIALHSLKERYENKIKMIYIDPPYNTGNDSFKYNDKFNRSTWLIFMKNRLEIAFNLLKEDGVIVVQSDSNENHYLKVLCDEIFGTEKFVTQISVEMSATQGMKVASAKNGNIVKIQNIYYCILKVEKDVMTNILYDPRLEYDTHYSKYLNKNNIVEDLKDVFSKEYPDIIFTNLKDMYKTSKEFKKFIDDNQERIFCYDKVTGFNKKNFEVGVVKKLFGRDRSYYIERKENNIKQLMFLSSSYGYANDFNSSYGFRKIRGDWWKDYYLDMGNVNKEGGVKLSNGKKPERLIKDLIIALTEKNDIILDFFVGSGTTPAVALKMERQFIGIEQLDYVGDLVISRLENVINGEQSAISKDVDWKGGGSFVYAELASLNEGYVKDIQQADSEVELEKVLSTMKESAYLNFKVDLERVSSKDKGYNALSLEEKKEVLIQVLDMNQLYLSYSEIEDEQYKIPEDVKSFNHSFYQKEGVQDE